MKDAPLQHRFEFALFRAFRGLVRSLPHEAARPLGRRLGDLAWVAVGRRRRVAVSNLALALPELAAAEHRRLARASIRQLGAALCDTLSMTRFDLAALCRRLEPEGWEHMEEAAAQGGFIGLTAHFGHWEVAAYLVGAYWGPLHVVGRPLDNPHLDRELAALRARFGNVLLEKRKSMRGILRALGGGEPVGLLIDQRVRPDEGIRLPFFGRPAVTTPLLARVSLRTGAPVVPIFCYPRPGGRYRLVGRPAILPEGVGEGQEAVATLTRRYLAVMEEEIRRAPEQWMWVHNRWKGGEG
jgi:KDO2-lipid IV(A) lauroyltransferase